MCPHILNVFSVRLPKTNVRRRMERIAAHIPCVDTLHEIYSAFYRTVAVDINKFIKIKR